MSLRLRILLLAGASGFAILFVSPTRGTFAASENLAWSGNVGWINWEAGGAPGAVIGEFVCSGYLYGANIGWIHLGNGIPGTHPSIPNAPYYSNASAADYGLNVLGSAELLKMRLRGLAWGANVGWIAFEDSGNPQVDLMTGRLSGYAWGANIGWINLGESGLTLRTERLEPGIDTDGDGIPDSWELLHAGDLATMSATSDSSGDGRPDIAAYRAGTDPFDPEASFRIIDFTTETQAGLRLTWTSVPTRLYRVEARESLTTGEWTTLLDNIPPATDSTSVSFEIPETESQFYRVEAFRPLVQ